MLKIFKGNTFGIYTDNFDIYLDRLPISNCELDIKYHKVDVYLCNENFLIFMFKETRFIEFKGVLSMNSNEYNRDYFTTFQGCGGKDLCRQKDGCLHCYLYRGKINKKLNANDIIKYLLIEELTCGN